MDFSSSSSSSSSQYKTRVLSSTSSRPRWIDLPIYESTPHYPPMENRLTALSSQETGRLVSSSNYTSDYTNYSYGAGAGGEAAAEKEGGGEAPAAEREHMFDKVVTPSDVGKLNRLVIPKQHAEKYFPLDSAANEKGLLLNFEDRNGKSWRFRYSYWNSSQSYVMTKGWSRFVKEKKLDAGDIVSFQRGVGDVARDRFYIDWRRRPHAPPSQPHQHGFSLHHSIPPPFLPGPHPPPLPPPLGYHQLHHRGSGISYGAANYSVVSPNFYHQGPMIYLRAAPQQQMQIQGGSSRADQPAGGPMVFESVPVVHGKADPAKRLRLFGVNISGTQDERDVATSSPPDDAGLQLRLHGGASSSATSSFQAIQFLDKGCCCCRCFLGQTHHLRQQKTCTPEICRALKRLRSFLYIYIYQLINGDVWKMIEFIREETVI